MTLLDRTAEPQSRQRAAEVATVAHVLLDGSLLDDRRDPLLLSPAAQWLLDLLYEQSLVTRLDLVASVNVALCADVSSGMDPVLADEIGDLAAEVAALRVGELAQVGGRHLVLDLLTMKSVAA